MSVLEREIEGAVVTWARKHGFLTPKVKFVEVGYPDRLFISPKGHTIFIEFKVPGAVPDAIQFYRIRELKRRGVPAFWVTTELDALVILKAALESTPVPGASNQADVESIGSGPVPGPGTGEDQCGSGVIKDSVRQAVSDASADSSTSESDAQHMARRDNKVGRLQGTNFLSRSRPDESRGIESIGPYPLDKPGGD